MIRNTASGFTTKDTKRTTDGSSEVEHGAEPEEEEKIRRLI